MIKLMGDMNTMDLMCQMDREKVVRLLTIVVGKRMCFAGRSDDWTFYYVSDITYMEVSTTVGFFSIRIKISNPMNNPEYGEHIWNVVERYIKWRILIYMGASVVFVLNFNGLMTIADENRKKN